MAPNQGGPFCPINSRHPTALLLIPPSYTQKTRISSIVHTTTIRYDARARGALPVYRLMGCL
ncbi:hypothetical protein NEUTE1DRAFT_117461, partial [Neurospora tetrasperma FGSC 2508]